MMDKALNIIIAGGGTGGHLFPGVAIAQAFLDVNPANRIRFVNAGRPMDRSVLTEAGFEYDVISIEGIKGRGIWAKMGAMFKIPRAVIESLIIVGRLKTDIVVGVGGYSAGPVTIAAWMLNVKTVLHEQNVLPGLTNRMLSRFAKRVFVSFEQTKQRFNAGKVRVTGNPVRKEIIENSLEAGSPVEGNEDTKPFTVLVLGGSQGAHTINISIMDALKRIGQKESVFFIHQTGAADVDRVKDAYLIHGINAEVGAFFNDLPVKYKKSDVIICRAGATTVAEITAIGKPSIFVPFPFAADNHQVLNAQTLVEGGAAEMILDENLNGKIIADRINTYRGKSDVLKQMADKAKYYGKPGAARDIVEACYSLFNDN